MTLRPENTPTYTDHTGKIYAAIRNNEIYNASNGHTIETFTGTEKEAYDSFMASYSNVIWCGSKPK